MDSDDLATRMLSTPANVMAKFCRMESTLAHNCVGHSLSFAVLGTVK